jgi:hypothetical protein
MRKTVVFLYAVAVHARTTPMFATTTCTANNGPGPLTPNWQCINSSPTTQFNFGFNSGQMCWPYYQGYYNSTGTYGYGTLEYSFTTESGYSTFDISFLLDLNNSHNSSSNRLAVIVYNDTDYTAETVFTIDGTGGNICSGQYPSSPALSLYRPQWAGKNMRLSIQTLFWDTDTQWKVSGPSFLQRT